MKYLDIQYTWTGFFTWAVLLFLLYFAIKITYQLLSRLNLLGRYQVSVLRMLKPVRLLSMPAIIIVLVSIFVLINPVAHGVIIALVLLLGFDHIRNYFSGKILRLNSNVALGKKISVLQRNGIIEDMTPIGLRLKTTQGLASIGYAKILTDGFLLVGSEDIGGIVQLRVQPKSKDIDVENNERELRSIITHSPFLDWDHIPEIEQDPDDQKIHLITISLKVHSQLSDLILTIEEAGYEAEVIS